MNKPIPAPDPNAEGLSVDEYVMDGIQRGNEDIEGSSSSVVYPPLSDEQNDEAEQAQVRG